MQEKGYIIADWTRIVPQNISDFFQSFHSLKRVWIKIKNGFRSTLHIAVATPDVRHEAAGRKIGPNTGANVTKFFTLATKSWKLVAKLATRISNHTLPRDIVIGEDL